jgi:iron(III) transport system substrate-binding protein
VVKVWIPKFEDFVNLHKEWIDEWNKIYGYRQ